MPGRRSSSGGGDGGGDAKLQQACQPHSSRSRQPPQWRVTLLLAVLALPLAWAQAACRLDMRGAAAGPGGAERVSVQLHCAGGTVLASVQPGVQADFSGSAHPSPLACANGCLVALCGGAIDLSSSIVGVHSAGASALCVAGANVTMRGLIEHTAVAERAVVHVTAGELHLRRATVRNNTSQVAAVLLGGGSGTRLSVHGCAFLDNRVASSADFFTAGGAAIAAQPGDRPVTIHSSVFAGNTVSGVGCIGCGGGAVSVVRRRLELRDVSFRDNRVTGDASEGGALFLRGGAARLVNVSFTGNTVLGDRSRGGALTSHNTTMELRRVLVENNTASGPFSRGGGAFLHLASANVLDASSLLGNAAEFGGALAAHDLALVVANSTIARNNATNYDGGALYIVSTSHHGTSVTLRDSLVASNRATFDGGALYARDADLSDTLARVLVTLDAGARLVDNIALRGSGGAVNVDNGRLVLERGCELSGNRANVNGGALAMFAGSAGSADAAAPGCTPSSHPLEPRLDVRAALLRNNTAGGVGGAGFVAGGVACHTAGLVQLSALVAASNTAAASTGFKLHDLCDAGYFSIEGGRACAACPAGLYKMLSDSATRRSNCSRCPSPGGLCPGGGAAQQLQPLPHWWLSDDAPNRSEPQLHWCPGATACPGFNATTRSQCSDGYQGRLCGECKPGWSNAAPFHCVQCPHTAARAGAQLAASSMLAIASVYALLLVAWANNQPAAGKPVVLEWGDAIRQLVWYVQALTVLGRASQYSWVGPADKTLDFLAAFFAQGELSAVTATHCLAGAAPAWADRSGRLPWGMFRSVLAVCLIVLYMLAVPILHLLVSALVAGVCALMPALLDTCLRCGPTKHASAARRQWLRLGGPLERTFGLPQAGGGVCTGAWWADLWQRRLLLVFVTLSFFAPTLLRAALGAFACVRVDTDPASRHAGSWWVSDVSVRCWHPPHLWWAIGWGGGMTLIFAVCVPLLHAFLQPALLPHAPDASGRCKPRSPGVAVLERYLYKTLRAGARVHEGAQQLRLVALVAVQVWSPVLGPFFSILLFAAFIAAFAAMHSMLKPFKDLALQHMQATAYSFLLLNAALGLVAASDNRATLKVALSELPGSGAADTAGDGGQRGGGAAQLASIAFVVVNTAFFVWGGLLIYSLLTRGLRGRGPDEPLLVHAAAHAPRWWVLGLGLTRASTLGLPITHAGVWHAEDDPEPPLERRNVFRACFDWFRGTLLGALFWWPPADAPAHDVSAVLARSASEGASQLHALRTHALQPSVSRSRVVNAFVDRLAALKWGQA